MAPGSRQIRLYDRFRPSHSLQQRFNDSSSVNVDQEMANLLTLQNSYAANARVLSTVKDMFDILLRM